MKRFDLSLVKAEVRDIYGTRDEYAKGRLVSLGSALITAFYNVFITGVFYTGFLSMYGISIAGVGIITFIPFIGSMFSVFSSTILGRVRHRKRVLLASKIYFYFMTIVATTVMPQFVTDPQMRLSWFVILLFLAYAVNALFSPGFTEWFYHFYPEDNTRRMRYIAYNMIFSSILSACILMISGVLADVVAGSPFQRQMILGSRYFAFALVLVDVGMQACAKEFAPAERKNISFTKVFTLPFKHRKFLYCMLLMFAWNYNSNVSNGLWSYHLLNHMHFPYTLINAMSVLYTVLLLVTTPAWRRCLSRYSWIKTFGIANLVWVPTELLYFFMTPERGWMYIFLSVWQHILNVGLNLSYANILYLNLPDDDPTTHIAFSAIGCNLFAALGLMTGTWVSAQLGDEPFLFMGMQTYAVQFTTLIRFTMMLLIGLVCVRKWQIFTPDEDVRIVESTAVKPAGHRLRRQ